MHVKQVCDQLNAHLCRQRLEMEFKFSDWRFGGVGVGEGLDKATFFTETLGLALRTGTTFLALKVLKTGLPLSFSLSRYRKNAQ